MSEQSVINIFLTRDFFSILESPVVVVFFWFFFFFLFRLYVYSSGT